jgi:hypothetical protein
MKVIAIVVLAVLANWAAWHGCSSGNGGVTREAGEGPPGGGGGAGGGGGGAAETEAGCPAAVPVNGKACAPVARMCTYGDAPRGECRPRATCVAGRWAAADGACAPAADPSECPGLVPDATVACAAAGQLCAYAGGVECVCLGGGAGWLCDTPRSPGAGCPATAPNAGTACTPPTSCTYPCGLLTMHAVFATCGPDAVWTWALMPCANTNRLGRLNP